MTRLRDAYTAVRSWFGWAFSPLENLIYATIIWAITRSAGGGTATSEVLAVALALVTVIGLYARRYLLLYREWEYYKETLGKVVYAEEGGYVYDELTFVYSVGRHRRRDQWIRRYSIVALGNVLMAKDIRFGARGAGTKPIPFSALKVRAFDATRGGRSQNRKVHVVPYAREYLTDHWEGALYFDPPIPEGETFRCTVSGFWPGLWDPLRATGKDRCRVQLTRPARVFEIAITTPEALTLRPSQYIRHPNGVAFSEPEVAHDASGRKQLVFRFEKAVPGDYEVEVVRQDAA